jgi:hypothetical protein
LVAGDDISRPRIDVATDPLSAWAKVGEAALGPAEVIAAELRTACAPDLAMLVVAGCRLRQAPGVRRARRSGEGDYNGRESHELDTS